MAFVYLVLLNVFGVKIAQHVNCVQQTIFLLMVLDALIKDLQHLES